MEAAGIEPASEDIQQTASTCLSSSASRSEVFEEEEHCRTSPDEVSLAKLRTNLARYPARRRFKHRRKTPEKRHAYLLGSNR